MHAAVTQFNNLAEHCNQNGNLQQAAQLSTISAQLAALGNRHQRGMRLLAKLAAQGVSEGQQESKQATDRFVADPLKVISDVTRELSHAIAQATLNIAEITLKIGAFGPEGQKHFKALLQQQKEVITSGLDSLSAMSAREITEKVVPFITKNILLFFASPGMAQAVLARELELATHAAQGLGLLMTVEAKAAQELTNIPEEAKKLSAPVSTIFTEAAEINQLAAREGVQVVQRGIDAVRQNPGLVAQEGSVVREVKRAVENFAEGSLQRHFEKHVIK